MGDKAKIRCELSAATTLLLIAGVSLVSMTAKAQMGEAVNAARTVAGLNPVELMALVCLLSLGLCAYLIRLLFGRLLAALDSNTQANHNLAVLLSERPCIRDPRNN